MLNHNYKVGDICFVWNDSRTKMCTIIEIIDNRYCKVHPIFTSGISRLVYTVEIENLEKVNLFEEFNLYNKKMIRR